MGCHTSWFDLYIVSRCPNDVFQNQTSIIHVNILSFTLFLNISSKQIIIYCFDKWLYNQVNYFIDWQYLFYSYLSVLVPAIILLNTDEYAHCFPVSHYVFFFIASIINNLFGYLLILICDVELVFDLQT